MTDTAKTTKVSLNLSLENCFLRDRGRFIQRLRQLRQQHQQQKPLHKALQSLHDDVAASNERVARRRALVSVIDYPDELPIAERRDDIKAAIASAQVVVIAGETGSGKTTQIPKICLEMGRGCRGLIGHTQPRRIAARTVADRIAEELNSPLGELVGYQVRFNDQSGANTLVKLMTDGILLAEIQNDPLLFKYDTIIIDEAHERSLNIDFLLGYIKQILPKRPDLKVIITSATIDVERFSEHFNQAPVISVSGRTYPVEILYRPPLEQDEDNVNAIVAAAEELLALPKRGDILIFLSGERDIREASTALRRSGLKNIDVLPLYGRLSLAEQNRIFHSQRSGKAGIRIVLATNVAETSVTVPGIRYVIDTGFARISRYSYRTKVQRLPIEPISQASANQRSGRCGRLSDGVCLRLYSQEDFEQRPAFTDPEIVRTHLAAVILQMLQMRIGDIRDFPFVDSPDNRLINDGFQLLLELQAVDAKGTLTDRGRTLSKLPVDPRLANMLITASSLGALQEVMVITAMLSLQDPRERPAEKRQAADEKHRQWQHKESDFLSMLQLWQHMEEQRQALSRRKFSDYCHSQFVSYLRMKEWRDLHHQLHLACRHAGLIESPQAASYEAVHQSLLSGLLSRIGFRHQDKEYLGVRNRKFHIFPGSGITKNQPKWIIAGELLETSRLFAHNVARIEPEWIPPLASHLLRKSHSEPYYDGRRGQVLAFEKQTLMGLTIQERKKVAFAPIDPVVARQVFIRGALVEQGYKGKGPFYKHNQQLLAELAELEDRLRRRGLLPDDDDMYRFYDERLTTQLATLKSFEGWRKKTELAKPRFLYLQREQLLAKAHLQEAGEQFPKALQWKNISYQIRYRFEPGHGQDGVTVKIPVPQLHQTPNYLFEWQVPGLLREKCIALVKNLPKHYRKQLVPVPDYVDKALPGLQADNVPLSHALAHQIKRHTAIDIAADTWSEDSLDNYYRISYQLVDERGKELACSKNLAELKTQFRATVQQTIHKAAGSNADQKELTEWSFGALKASQRIRKGALDIDVYPALIDDDSSVSLTLIDNPEEAEAVSRKGVVRLFMLAHTSASKYLRKQLFKGQALAIVAAGLDDHKQLRDDLIQAAYHHACLGEKGLPRNEDEFKQYLDDGQRHIVKTAQDMEKVVVALLPHLKNVRQLQKKHQQAHGESVDNSKRQVDFLFRADFLLQTSPFWLQQYPRYFKALGLRLEKIPAQLAKEQSFCQEISAFDSRCQTVANHPLGQGLQLQQQLMDFRYNVEEYRVSTFAQVLKTVKPVSYKRLNVALTSLEKSLQGG